MNVIHSILKDHIMHVFFNPVPTRLCHVTYYHGDKKYPCLVGIRLSDFWGFFAISTYLYTIHSSHQSLEQNKCIDLNLFSKCLTVSFLRPSALVSYFFLFNIMQQWCHYYFILHFILFDFMHNKVLKANFPHEWAPALGFVMFLFSCMQSPPLTALMPKGQLISKANFRIFIWTKKPMMIFLYFCPSFKKPMKSGRNKQ